MEFAAEKSGLGTPMATLRDGDVVVMQVYITPDGSTIKISLPALRSAAQLKVSTGNGVIEFRRRP